MSRMEIAGDICWRRPKPTVGCRADDGDDYDDDKFSIYQIRN
jgi:hypothetical protein